MTKEELLKRIKRLEEQVKRLTEERFDYVHPLFTKGPCTHPAHQTAWIGNPPCPICFPEFND